MYGCFLCRRVSPSNASGSFCPTRSWIQTASSDSPSKTVCAFGPSVQDAALNSAVPRLALPSSLSARLQGAGSLQSGWTRGPCLVTPRGVNLHFCFLAERHPWARPLPEGQLPEHLDFDSILGRCTDRTRLLETDQLCVLGQVPSLL